jgi:hypothetical protein
MSGIRSPRRDRQMKLFVVFDMFAGHSLSLCLRKNGADMRLGS